MLAVHRLRRTWSRDVSLYIALTDFARNKFIAGGLPAAKIIVKPNFVTPDPGAEPAAVQLPATMHSGASTLTDCGACSTGHPVRASRTWQ